MIGTLLGGIGLFLLGMILLTEGLKSAAGDALRSGLARFTGGAARAVASGAGITALVQSSSATVVTTIGFVSAGLLTFTQAVGVIFGANLGTTSTGWIVSALGLKVSVAALALPLVGVGALARFLLHGRAASVGLAVAGFGVIFVGIDVLQEGMTSLSAVVDPAVFPGETLTGRLALVVVGALMTVALQSSSAAVATTLTALHSGAVDLSQATMLVIGQNIGTTVTAALASLGATVPARRTGLAHILFNVVTGAAAFLLAPLFLSVVDEAGVLPGARDPALALAAFHTAFNALGILLLLPVAPRFAALVIRLVPDRGPRLTRHLDPSVARIPEVGLEAARRTALAILAASTELVVQALESGGRVPRGGEGPAVREALREVRGFLREVRTPPGAEAAHRQHLALLHAVDHMERLVDALDEGGPHPLPDSPQTSTVLTTVRETLTRATARLEEDDPLHRDALARLSARVANYRRTERVATLERAASQRPEAGATVATLESLRWLDRVVYHVWRAAHHLGGPDARPEPGAETAEAFADPEGRHEAPWPTEPTE
jgi:phosphate:Na+ symporter